MKGYRTTKHIFTLLHGHLKSLTKHRNNKNIMQFNFDFRRCPKTTDVRMDESDATKVRFSFRFRESVRAYVGCQLTVCARDEASRTDGIPLVSSSLAMLKQGKQGKLPITFPVRENTGNLEILPKLRPSSNRKIVSCPPAGWAKKGLLELFFSSFQKKIFFFTSPPVHSSLRKLKLGIKKKNPDLPTGIFSPHPAHRKRFFT